MSKTKKKQKGGVIDITFKGIQLQYVVTNDLTELIIKLCEEKKEEVGLFILNLLEDALNNEL